MASGVVRLAVIAMVCLGSGACYRYTPATVGRLAPETEVRARVSAAEAERLRAHAGGDGRVLEGRFLGADEDRILLEVAASSQLRGMRVETLHQRLDIRTAEILELERKELDRTRTFLVTGAGAAVMAGFVLARLGPGGGSAPPGEGQPPAEYTSFLRLLLPFGR